MHFFDIYRHGNEAEQSTGRLRERLLMNCEQTIIDVSVETPGAVEQSNDRLRKRLLLNSEQTNIDVSIETPGAVEQSTDRPRERLLLISEQTNIDVSVETPGAVATALEKLDHILTQNLITLEDVIKRVGYVRDDLLGDTQNIILSSNLSSTAGELSQREKLWLEEVKDVCDYTVGVAEKFIARTERRLSMGRLWKVFYLYGQYASEQEFSKQMEYISTQFGDALYRRWIFGDRGDKIGSRSRPVAFPSFSPPANLFTVIARTVSLWRSLDENLKTSQRYLALMSALFSDIGSADEGLNQRQKVWVNQLKLVARKGESLVAAYPKDGFPFSVSRYRYAKNINRLLNEIIHISDRKNIYDIANIQGGKQNESIAEDNHNSPDSICYRDTTELDTGEKQLMDALLLDVKQSGYEDNHNSPDSICYRDTTELDWELDLITGEKQLMDALLLDVKRIGYEDLDGRYKIWVNQIKGIARETKAVIDESGGRELDRKPMLNRIRQKIKDASRSRKAHYGLVQCESGAESLRPRTQPFFNENVKVLMAQLLSDEKFRCITSIVGIKGTGKTKLAKMILRNEAVINHFDYRIFVPPSYATVEQIKEYIAKKAAEIIKGDKQNALATLASKKHLIVIDGIETPHVLDTLIEIIPDMLTASRFLLTTHNANVAQQAGMRSFVHPLQLLDDENSWTLFTTDLKVNIPLESKLSETGKKIVAKCGGLPLEIRKTRSLLSGKDVTQEDWSSVLKHPNLPLEILKISKLFSRKDVTEEKKWSSVLKHPGLPSEILKIIKLLRRKDLTEEEWPSVRQNPWSDTLNTININLPSHLRRCLFYFELFPANFGIAARRLVALWVAEGLVHHGEDQEPPEQVAERYLKELIDLNLVQIAKSKPNGTVKTCRLPHALHDLLLRKPEDARFPQVYTSKELIANQKYPEIREVADRLDENHNWHQHIHGNITNDSPQVGTYYKGVHSFLSFDFREGSRPGQELCNFLNLCISSNCLLLLRVLDLEGVYKPKLPESIERLTRLRYLGLRWTYLESLPSSISSLLQLQTLDLKHTYIHTLTSSIWNMKLRHLFLSETYRTRFPSKPKGTGNSLSDVQTMWGLFVDEETPVKGGLDQLVNITKLGIACQSMSLQQEVMESQLDAVADWIVKLEYLQSLRLKSRNEEGQPWKINLKSLKKHNNLTDMYLLGSLTNASVLFPESLVELTLSHSKLENDPMKILKDLPNLRSLSLLAESYEGEKMICKSKSFPQLYVLKVWNLKQLKNWLIKQQALPSLRQLEIRSCPGLTNLPFGLWHVKSLLELTLTNMSKEINIGIYRLPDNCKVRRDNSQ